MGSTTPMWSPGPRAWSRSGLHHLGLLQLLTGLLALTTGVATAGLPKTLPYVPTTILLPTKDQIPIGGKAKGPEVAYIFAPGTEDNGEEVEFLKVNLTSKLKADNLAPTRVTKSLPFVSKGSINQAFAPLILENGTLAIVKGDCSSSSTTPELWKYNPLDPKAEWTHQQITIPHSFSYDNGFPAHLGAAFSFSPQLAPSLSSPEIYLYAGMCPNETAKALPSSSWQSAATYSNAMIRLSPVTSPSSSAVEEYAPSVVTPPNASKNNGGGFTPLPEAGFSLTQLTPSLIKLGDGTVTQQTRHLLLGGHTAEAFVNMSTAALFSLPDETWRYVSIAGPIPSGGEVLLGEVESRSGHTAVLSEDGKKIVVFGGWVGDIYTAAQPQLVVLEVGVGGDGWVWEVPAVSNGFQGGVFGHGAAVLPGNVMMVYGGYEIGEERRVRKRGVEQGVMFFNITAMKWQAEYINPLQQPLNPKQDPSNNPSSNPTPEDTSGSINHKRDLALGLGIALGVLFLSIVAFFVIRSLLQRRKRRAARDAAIRSLSQGFNGSLPRGLSDDDAMLEQDGGDLSFPWPWNGDTARAWYTGGEDPYASGSRSLGYESLRRGKLGSSLYMPPPPPASSGNGRPRAARGLFHPGPGGGYDFSPLGRSRGIEPIYEADEEDEYDEKGLKKETLAEKHPLSPTNEEETEDDDPFVTPSTATSPTTSLLVPRTVSPVTPSNKSLEEQAQTQPQPQPQAQVQSRREGQQQDPDVRGWVSDVDATETELVRRLSQSGSRPGAPLRRVSTKSASGKAPATPKAESDRTGSDLSEKSAFSFAKSSDEHTQSGSSSSSSSRILSKLRLPSDAKGDSNPSLSSSNSSAGASFSTAKSHLRDFATLRAEGPRLLLGRGLDDSSDSSSSDEEDDLEREVEETEDGYVQVPGSPSKSKPRRRSWLGSLRRVFSGGSASMPSAPGESVSKDKNAHVGEGTSTNYDLEGVVGSALLQRRRQAWLGYGFETEDGTGDDDDGVERAVEGRLVQVMFTVPKERLRVVNADIEKEEEAVLVNADDTEPRDQEPEESQPKTEGKTEETRDEPKSTPSDPSSPPETTTADLSSTTTRLTTSTLTATITTLTSPTTTASNFQPPTPTLQVPTPTLQRTISPSPSILTASSSSSHVGETVRPERPRTRVLDMVETFEARARAASAGNMPVGSRSGTPSPTRRGTAGPGAGTGTSGTTPGARK
ncbi:uncharacterized protein CTHT_0037970 [Thermochaetoides thermophila DSM 1495]|uniref:Uncharacterized protein n=1 Tax=Chaetomium thermophilum (strain DSM 1495 / CBS 144.50 / IMI 039719) TaxID=759272 RepID=G0S889_CHATD|nr:hypothetical protein CTHT_0037970 [Thermochaetoides thermophila DSM 1495]EGS21923.1 hypothetical protein CTHT_0037970 [Thermochaetoides thermophila DSM 1495]